MAPAAQPHALMEQETIERGPDGDGERETCMGSLAAEQFDALLPILARHTTSPDGWFLLWDGFGDLDRRVFTRNGPKVAHWARDFYLLRGPLGSFADFPNDPSSGGPTTARGACVPTSTAAGGYVAGSAVCIDEILAVPVLDAMAARPDNPAHSGMDMINDPDGTVPRRG